MRTSDATMRSASDASATASGEPSISTPETGDLGRQRVVAVAARWEVERCRACNAVTTVPPVTRPWRPSLEHAGELDRVRRIDADQSEPQRFVALVIP